MADRDPYHPVWGSYPRPSALPIGAQGHHAEIERFSTSQIWPSLFIGDRSRDMLTRVVRTAGEHGGWRRLWGSAVMLQIYWIVIIGVLCNLFLLASLDRAGYEVNTFTS